MEQPQILIIDLSSQVAELISRTLRELGHRSVIFGPEGAKKWLEKNKPKGIIPSGGQQSVYDENALMPPEEILEMGIPVLGICFGMQWMAHVMRGRVVANTDITQLENKNYGESFVKFSSDDIVFKDVSGHEYDVWASHGDSVARVPAGFKEIGWFSSGTIAAMADASRGFFAVQYHPEVTHTPPPAGKEILRRFVEDVCGCEKNWSEGDLIGNLRNEIAEVVGDKKAILPYSGGVDSSVVLALSDPVLEERLSVFTIDTGALRDGELNEIVSNAKEIGVAIRVIDDSHAYFNAMANLTDAEEKRIRGFQSVYGPRLDLEGKSFGASFIFQGTNAADQIESAKKGQSGHIKTHHNTVETLLEKYNPLRNFFKYEIRALAYKLGLSEAIAERKPFPGPGLFLRVNGMFATPDRIAIVRWADVVVMSILKEHGIYQEISQCPVNILGVPTVGIKGDKRVYKYPIVVHPVQTMDFMTSRGYQIPKNIRREITREVSKHPEVVRVLFDEGDKPPASTEWE